MGRRSAPEVNAGSMADIAFLLLIFFLVTTTIETDSGINRKLPPMEEIIDPPIIKERNIFTVVVNKNNQILVEEKLMELRNLRSEAVSFLDNGGGLAEEACNYCQGSKDRSSSDNPDKAIISLKNDRETDYKVYISVKPTAAPFLTTLQKAEVLNLLESKKMVGITPVIVDPEYTYIYFEIFFKYDPSGTNTSAAGLASIVKQTLIDYNQTKLNNFDGVFRHSNLLASIDNSNPAILNNIARVYAYKNVNITASSLDSASVDFGFVIDGKLTQEESMIKTSTIQIGGVLASLADKPIAGDTQKRQIYAYQIDEQGREVIVTPNVGFVYPATGKVDLSNLKNDVDELLRVEVSPASDDIISQRKKILQIDVERTTVKGDIDNISIAGSAGLSTYTTVSRD